MLLVMTGAGPLTTPLRETLFVAPPPDKAKDPARLFVTGALVGIRTATTPPVGAKVSLLDPAVAKALVEIS